MQQGLNPERFPHLITCRLLLQAADAGKRRGGAAAPDAEVLALRRAAAAAAAAAGFSKRSHLRWLIVSLGAPTLLSLEGVGGREVLTET